jgi:hypothetical protein
MTTNQENLENPGIFVRIRGADEYEVLWMDGNQLIELATTEERSGGDPITDHLEKKHIDNYSREIYDPLGRLEDVMVLRRLTLRESVHYLGRNVKICAFLRPKEQAARFILGLKKSKDVAEQRAAVVIEQYLYRFDESAMEKLSQSGIYRLLEEQLMSITTE